MGWLGHNCHRGLPVAVPLGQLALGFMCTTNKRAPQDKKALKKCPSVALNRRKRRNNPNSCNRQQQQEQHEQQE